MHNTHRHTHTCSEVGQGREGVGGRMEHREVWPMRTSLRRWDLSSTVKERRGGKLQVLQ